MGMLMGATKIICFDIGGTLIQSGPSFAAAIQRLASRPLLRAEWNRFLNLAVGPVEQDLARLAEHLGLRATELLQIYAAHSGSSSQLFADVIPTLKSLAPYRCVALSNAPRWLVTDSFDEAAVHLKAVFYSHEIGHSKPDAEAFRFVERALGVRGEDILMVGDSLAYDYEGALQAGWNAVLLDREDRYAGNPAVTRIRGLAELIERFDALVARPGEGAQTPNNELVRKVERAGAAVLVQVPAEILGCEYTARPVLVRSRSGSCRGRVARRQSGEVFLLLGPTQCGELGISPSEQVVRLQLEVVAEKLQLSPPADLEFALLDAGLSWDAMPERDRHLAVGLIKEAKTPELRRGRIHRIVSALRGETT